MIRGSVAGCSVSRSRFSAKLGLPYPFECSSDFSDIASFREVVHAVREASEYMSSIIGVALRISGFRGWEYSGQRFNLYSFGLEDSEGRPLGVIRVVESGGYIVNLTGALFGSASVYSEVLGQLDFGDRIEEGDNLAHVMLDRKPKEGPMPWGQKSIGKFVIYAAEGIPKVDLASWRLEILGDVKSPVVLSYDELNKLSYSIAQDDFHCVTGWSVLGVEWRGARLSDLLKMARVDAEDGWVVFESVGGYTTIVPMKEALSPGSMVVVGMNGRPLSEEAGFPARIYIPQLYGWKHAKWLAKIIVVRSYEDGYWEALSYHERGLAWSEERFKVRNFLVAEEGALLGDPRPLKPDA